MPSTQIVVAALAATVILALTLAGVFCERYQDNLTQRAGMATMGLAAMGVLLKLTMGGSLNNPLLLLAVGVAIYAVGTAYKQVTSWQSQG